MKTTRSFSTKERWCLVTMGLIYIIISILLNRYLKNHTHIVLCFMIVLPLMYWIFLMFFNIKTPRIIWNKFKNRLYKRFGSKKELIKRLINTCIGVIISGFLYLMLIGLQYTDWFYIPSSSNHEVELFYLIISVPGQQLFFFIWPWLILDRFLSAAQRMLVMITLIVLFGNLHNYYPNIVTPILAATTLGAPSAYLVFIRKDPYAAIFSHMIIGSFAIQNGLV